MWYFQLMLIPLPQHRDALFGPHASANRTTRKDCSSSGDGRRLLKATVDMTPEWNDHPEPHDAFGSRDLGLMAAVHTP